MAGLFNTLDSGAPLGSSVTPQNPVADNSAALPVQLATTVARGVYGAMEENALAARAKATRDLKVADETEEGRVVSSLTNKLSDIANAVELGLPSAEAGVRKRAELNRLQAENPRWAKELQSTFNAFGTDAGAVSKTGNTEEQLYKDQYKEASLAGAIPQGTPSKDVPAFVNSYMIRKAAERELEATMKQLDLTSKNLSIAGQRTSNAKGVLELQKSRLEQQSRIQVKTIADSFLPTFRGRMASLIEQANQPGADRTSIQQQMDVEYASVQAVINNAPDAGSDYINALADPFQTVLQASKDYASGKIKLEEYNTNVGLATAKASMDITGNPDVARVVSLVKMVPSAINNGAVAITLNQIALGTLGQNDAGRGNANPQGVIPKAANPFDDARKDGYKEYLEYTDKVLRDFNAGKPIGGKDAEDQLSYQVKRIMDGAATYSSVADGPEDMNDLAKFVASDSFGAYVSKRGGLPGDAKTQESVNYLFQQQYIQQGEQAIKKEFLKATEAPKARSGNTDTLAAPNQIELVFSGGGAVFRPKAGGATNAQASEFTKNKIKELNKNVAPLVNRLTRISAHLSGNTNYQAAFNDIYNNILQDASNDQQ